MSYSYYLVEVLVHPEAERELERLSTGERVAMQAALEKLEALGVRLPFPHQSAVKGAGGLRELRPRAAGAAGVRCTGVCKDAMVILAIGPEAEVDKRGFDRAVSRARERLAELEPSPEKTRKKGRRR